MKPKTEKEKLMNLIARKITDTPAITPEEIAIWIKQKEPSLKDLNAEQMERISEWLVFQRKVNELNAKVDLAGIDWVTERETFLTNASKTNSVHTYTAYSKALNRLEAYAKRMGINPLSLTPAQADDFIYAMKAEERAPATIRKDAAACSSFFTFLERRHAGIKNPFRGTKARPPKKDVRKTEIPNAKEVKIIIDALGPMEAAAVSIMAYRGLRAGALPELTVKAGRFSTHSKGKDIAGDLPAKAIDAIKTAGLDLRKPFALNRDGNPLTVNAIERRINYHIGKLYKAGKINAAYSCHDFRHFYAITEYRKTKDIHRVSKLLDHAGIAVTEKYLKGLGEIE
jgi:site-specific recombinase XerD